jgi:acyl-CoA hydrolase
MTLWLVQCAWWHGLKLHKTEIVCDDVHHEVIEDHLTRMAKSGLLLRSKGSVDRQSAALSRVFFQSVVERNNY